MLKLTSIGNEGFDKYLPLTDEMQLAAYSTLCSVTEYDLHMEFELLATDMDILFAVSNYEETYGRDERAETIFSNVYETLGNEGVAETIRIYAQKVVHWIKVFIAWIKDFLKQYIGKQQFRAKKFKQMEEAWKDATDDQFKALADKEISTTITEIDSHVVEALTPNSFKQGMRFINDGKTEGVMDKMKTYYKSIFGKLNVKTEINLGNGLTFSASELKETKRKASDIFKHSKQNLVDVCKHMSAFAVSWSASNIYTDVEKSMQEQYDKVQKAAKDSKGEIKKEDLKEAIDKAKFIKNHFNNFRIFVDKLQATIISVGIPKSASKEEKKEDKKEESTKKEDKKEESTKKEDKKEESKKTEEKK